MNGVLKLMMAKHPEMNDVNTAKNVIKQIMQEIVLCSLGRTDFFDKAAFNGGTALRIFHGLTRFSEDLDFSVDKEKNSLFSIGSYKLTIDNEMESLGIPAEFFVDTDMSTVQRGYIRGNCREVFRAFGIEEQVIAKVASNEVLKIKIEADTTPLDAASFEHKFLLKPYPSEIRVYDRGSLFAGKINAILTRQWKSRVKGRDLYDFIFYVSEGYPINYAHLTSRLISAGVLEDGDFMDEKHLKEKLVDKFSSIDMYKAKRDVEPFVEDARSIDIWSNNFFVEITKETSFT